MIATLAWPPWPPENAPVGQICMSLGKRRSILDIYFPGELADGLTFHCKGRESLLDIEDLQLMAP